MSEQIFTKVKEVLQAIQAESISSIEELESFRIKYLGSKNTIKPLFAEMRHISNDSKKDFGLRLNELKQTAEAKYKETKQSLGGANTQKSDVTTGIDLSVPPGPLNIGARHPVTIVLNQMIEVFGRIGFSVAEDREIEDDWHNFTAMNTPEHHPARDMQDTFYLKDSTSMLLRTHTSSVQARVMTTRKPPIRIIAPGRVFRNETISARSHCQFHQVEGLYIDEGVSFADMKQTLLYFAKEMYGPDTDIRLRPSYFPFTEPSAEMDVWLGTETETARKLTKGTGWLEVLGCGMVDPNVLDNCGIDSTVYSGYAFGIGIERSAMQKYDISDIRLLFENDSRFLSQFASAF